MLEYKVCINKIDGQKQVDTIEQDDLPQAVNFIRFEYKQDDVKSVGIFHADGKVFSYANKVTGRKENF